MPSLMATSLGPIFFSSWVNMRLHIKKQLPGLPGTDLKVSVLVLGWVAGSS